jgi:GT2 family glycosyltransferase
MYSLIVVDYNSPVETIAYINRCQKALITHGALHIVIVDNASDKRFLELLSDAFGTYTDQPISHLGKTVQCFQQDGCSLCYCCSGENMGYARGNNLGAKVAKALWNDPFYIISNNDLVFNDVVDLTPAEDLFAKHPEIGAIGPRIISALGAPQSPNHWQGAFHRLILNTWLGAAGAIMSEHAYQKLENRFCTSTVSDATTGPCAWISGCFMIVERDAFFEAGMFDEHTFLYAEEMILSRRMEKVGKEIWFCRDIEVVHKHAQTTRKALSVIRMRQMDFESCLYYYQTYEQTSRILLKLAKWNFVLYKKAFYLWQIVKKNHKEHAEDTED